MSLNRWELPPFIAQANLVFQLIISSVLIKSTWDVQLEALGQSFAGYEKPPVIISDIFTGSCGAGNAAQGEAGEVCPGAGREL